MILTSVVLTDPLMWGMDSQ